MKYNKRKYKSAKELRLKKTNNKKIKRNTNLNKKVNENYKVDKLRNIKNRKQNNKKSNKSNKKEMKGGNEYNIDTCLNEIKNFAVSKEYQGPFTNEKCFTGGADGEPCRYILGGPRLCSKNTLNHKNRTPGIVKINEKDLQSGGGTNVMDNILKLKENGFNRGVSTDSWYHQLDASTANSYKIGLQWVKVPEFKYDVSTQFLPFRFENYKDAEEHALKNFPGLKFKITASHDQPYFYDARKLDKVKRKEERKKLNDNYLLKIMGLGGNENPNIPTPSATVPSAPDPNAPEPSAPEPSAPVLNVNKQNTPVKNTPVQSSTDPNAHKPSATGQNGGSIDSLKNIKNLLSKNDLNSYLKADKMLDKLRNNYNIGGNNMQTGGGNIKSEYFIKGGYWNKMAYYNADNKTTNKLQSIENFIDNYKNKNKYIKKL